ncbi:MAG: pitrilysin family protein [Caldisericia bacterium]|jgi:predicted Zn-dependent peptidase|nr:pitrilysin family protein [Caldisericia bacterium]
MDESLVKVEPLFNGSTLIYQKGENFPSFSLFILVPAGSIYESENTNGYSHFIEHLVFKGTQRRDSKQISIEVEGIGCDMNAFTSSEYTGYYIRGRDKSFEKASDVLLDIIQNPIFPPNEIEKEKNVVIEEYNSIEDSPEELSLIELKKAMWGNSTFSYDVIGKVENIKNSTRDSLLSFFKDFYHPKNIIISFYGNLDFDYVKKKIEEKLRRFDYEKKINFLEEPKFISDIKVRHKDIKQVYVHMGFKSTSVLAKEYPTQIVLINTLGGGMSSRLFQRIREDMGLVYSIYSFNLSYKQTGAGVIYFATSKNNLQKVLYEIKNEFETIRKESFKDEEIERSKEFLIGNLLLKLENSLAKSERNGVNFFRKGYVERIEDTIDKIQKVNKDNLMEEFYKLEFEKFSFGVCGDITEDEFRRIIQ